MKKIIITLVATILVFVTTIIVMYNYVEKKTLERSDEDIAHILDTVCAEIDNNLIMTKNSAYGFLTGNFLIENPDSSGAVMVEHTDKRFFEAGMQKRLDSFLKANPYYQSAMFIIQTDTLSSPTPQSFYAPVVNQGSDSIDDVAKHYDFTASANYKRCCQTKKSFWTIPSRKSRVAGHYITFYVPLCRQSNGKAFGAFVVSLDISTLDKKIERYLPYGKEHSEMLVATNDGIIISSYPTYYKKFHTIRELDAGLKFSGKEYGDEENKERTAITYNDEIYFQYQRPQRQAQWTLFTVCKESAIYADAHKIAHVVLITSLIGMMLILIACVVISQQVRRTHAARIAAEQELSMAAMVQARMLRPAHHQSPPLHAFMRPAREAGGDLYDYADIDGKLIFCIGDVSGKGMPAALFMTQVVSLFRSAIHRTSDPAAIVSSINNVLADSNPDMTFCTLYVAVLDGDKLTFCNAGHNPSVLLKDSAECSFVAQKPNVAVGLLKSYPYTSQSLDISRGDTLLLYTDGISEAMNGKHHQYGDQAILDNLSRRTSNQPDHCTQLLVDSVATFVHGAEQSDDITVMAVNVA